MTSNLTDEEKELLDAYERDEFVSVATPELRKEIASAAKNTGRKDKRVNIRISQSDLERIRERALMEGIPYQTLMASVLHKFVHGRLVERSSY